MESEIVRLDSEHSELLELVSLEIETNEESLKPIYIELDRKRAELAELNEKIKPYKQRLSVLGELKAGIASKKSRVKYFPEFATRNYDNSKDKEFFDYVSKHINPDKVNR